MLRLVSFFVLGGFLAVLAMLILPLKASAVCPYPLQNCVDTTMPVQNGRTINVLSGGNLQQAFDSAQLGDTIILEAGASFTGPFTLPKKTGQGWIIVRSSNMSSLPPEGIRVSPAHSSAMPKIITNDSQPAMLTANGAHHYRFIGIEFVSNYAGRNFTTYNLILLGDGSEPDVPHHIIFDRTYIHGNSNASLRRGIAMNGSHLAAIDSYISDVHEIGSDSQAIAGWSGSGPFKIVNNYLEGAAENVMFGGAGALPGLNPSDLEFRKNYSFKPLSWRGNVWSVKNLFELKDMRRALIDGNIFENNWTASQSGIAIVITPVSSQSGPDAVVEDVVFSNNIIRHAGGGIGFVGTDYTDSRYPNQGVQARRIQIVNNLFDDISGATWVGNGWFALLTSGPGPDNLTFDHNTVRQDGSSLMLDGTTRGVRNFVFTNNLVHHNEYGVFGSGMGTGLSSMNEYLAPGYNFSHNVLIGGNPNRYPSGNFFPATSSDVGMVDENSGNYALRNSSPYKNAGTDHKDIGADFNLLNQAVQGVIAGRPSQVTPPAPNPVPPPAPLPPPPAPLPPPPPPAPTPSPNPTPTPTPLPPPPAQGVFLDGIMILDRGVIYIIEYGKKRPFVSMSVFSGLGFKLSNVINGNTSGIPEGDGIFRAEQRHTRGVLVNDNGTVYFMGADYRYPFPSEEVFFSWDNSFKNVVVANQHDRAVPIGPLIERRRP
ncbi:MAG TPA: hypothetical protein VD998_03255 [Verrucomicrobiae bacterium]|nr:hypothetical protein [Verrucomicrobiae bacterium]